MSFDGIKRADHTKGNRGDRNKLQYAADGGASTYRIKVKAMRGNESPEPPVLPWVAIDFVIMESDNPALEEGDEAGHAWTVGGQWGSKGFEDLKAFLVLAQDLSPEEAREIDRAVLLAIMDTNALAGVEMTAVATKGIYGKKSQKAGQHFTKVHFKKG